MPNFPIVDAHVHLWNPDYFPIPWVAGNALLDRRYTLPEYQAHTEGVNVGTMVYVQVDVAPTYALAEARWVAQQAEIDSRLEAIVAFAPVDDGERVRSYLDALVAVSPLVKGVRRILQAEPDARICLQPDFVRGVQLLGEYGLSFDVCIVHHQLEAATELVRRCPNTQFMLDHIAKPDIMHGMLEPWKTQIASMAALPNVVCKISGVATEADREGWTARDLQPYVAHVIDVFGENRIAFGGDWPVALLATPYPRWVQTLETLTAQLSAEAQRKLWVENAQRFYRFDDGRQTTDDGKEPS